MGIWILLPWWQSFGEFLVDSFSSFLWFVSFRWRNDFGGKKQQQKNKRMQQSLKSFDSPHVLAVHTPLLASLLLAADSVSPVRWRGFLLFLGLWFKLLLVPLVVRLLLLLLLLLRLLLLLLQLLLLLWMCCLGEGSLLLEWESCLQDQLRRLVVVEKTRALAARQCNDIRQWRKFFSLCSFSRVTESLINIYKCKWHCVHLRHTSYNFIIIRNIIKMKNLHSKIKHECYPIIPCRYNILNQWHLLPSSDTCRNCCCCCCPCWLLCATTAVWFWPSGCPWGAWAGCRVSVWVCPPCWSGTEG